MEDFVEADDEDCFARGRFGPQWDQFCIQTVARDYCMSISREMHMCSSNFCLLLSMSIYRRVLEIRLCVDARA